MAIYYRDDLALLQGRGEKRWNSNDRLFPLPHQLPPVSESDIKQMNNAFNHYIFVRKSDIINFTTEYYCSFCGNSEIGIDKGFTFDTPLTPSPYSGELMQSGHNGRATCPRCGKVGDVKQMRYVRRPDRFDEYKHFAVFTKASENEVFIRIIDAYRDRKNGVAARTSFYESEYYRLTPGGCEYYTYTWSGWHSYTGKHIQKPYSADIKVIGLEKLEGTFLKYSITPRFIEDFCYCICRACCFAALYPCTEMIYKFGFKSIISQWCEKRKNQAYAFDLTARTVEGLFKLPKDTKDYLLRACKENRRVKENITRIVSGLRLFGKDIAGLKLAIYWCDSYDFWSSQVLLREIYRALYGEGKMQRDLLIPILKYIEKNAEARVSVSYNCFSTIARYYRDYLNEGAVVGIDLKNEVVMFPKDFKKAHDSAVENANAVRDTIKNKAMAEKFKTLTAIYGFEENGYKVIAPRSTGEIVAEGKAMGHCVGGYAQRHAEGSTVILFIRKVDDLASSFATMELQGKKVVQVQGKRNNPTWKNEPDGGKGFEEFLADFKKFISKRVKPKKVQITV